MDAGEKDGWGWMGVMSEKNIRLRACAGVGESVFEFA